MNDLISVTDWSRWQFALTAIYHWLFVPLTLGLSVVVGVMETIWFRTRKPEWKQLTKFWMTLFGINFAIGVATGIILEFEFGTNWSNYSWFVGDIFGAPLAIEGLFAFFMEATFVAVMFFGWNKVSARFHLTATWLTALGASISALWILVANAWMQYPAGMEFNPDQMRNVMTNFGDLFSPIAINKFFHAVMSGWALAGIFVIAVSCWMLWRKRDTNFALRSIKVGAWIGTVGMLLTFLTGDGSAVEVARHQPMKLAAMEGLYNGSQSQEIVAFGILNPSKKWNDNQSEYSFKIGIPGGLSILARHDYNAFVPGIADIVNGIDINDNGDTINTVSYADRIVKGKKSHEDLRAYDKARITGDTLAAQIHLANFKENYPYFGYGYFDNVQEAIPPVGITFISFRVMVIGGSILFAFLLFILFAAYKKKWLGTSLLLQFIGMASLPLVYIVSQAGWIVAEVGRQPWTVQDLLPTRAAISQIPLSSVITTFWLFAAIFTILLIAEMSIMCRQIAGAPKQDSNITSENNSNTH